MRSDASLILNEPAPCDDCASADLCRFTGSACESFSMYVKDEPWHSASRAPCLKRGKALGLKAVEMTDADRERMRSRVSVY